jgi:hypothetical protein
LVGPGAHGDVAGAGAAKALLCKGLEAGIDNSFAAASGMSFTGTGETTAARRLPAIVVFIMS